MCGKQQMNKMKHSFLGKNRPASSQCISCTPFTISGNVYTVGAKLASTQTAIVVVEFNTYFRSRKSQSSTLVVFRKIRKSSNGKKAMQFYFVFDILT